jgi:1,4-dihydroxy-2-naphthoyl-CoA hydrolase
MGGLPGFIGMELVEFGPGTLRAKVEVREELLTAFGTMHGGVMAGFIDHVLGVVLYPLMQPGQWAATTEFKLNYLASVSKGTLVGRFRGGLADPHPPPWCGRW